MMRKFFDLACVPVLLALALIVSAPTNAVRAAPFDDALASLAKDNFGETQKAIDALATSDNERAAAVLEALRDRRLQFDDTGIVYYKDAAGKLIDARTGAEVATPPANLKTARLNNRVRNTLEAALGAMTLMSPDPAKRRSAAEAVFRSRDATALPALLKARDAEKDADIASLFAQAAAAILIAKPDATAPEKIDAIAVLKARGDQEALGLLRPVTADANPEIAAAAQAAVSSIEGHLKLMSGIQNVWYGLSLGSVLLLAAIGLAITFGVMGVINMAHGEMVMLGAYTTFIVQEIFRAYAPGAFDYSLLVARARRLRRRRGGRHRHRARHHPLPLRPPAGNAARHLGRQPDPAAGDPHDLRRHPIARSARRATCPAASIFSGWPSPITGSGSSSSRSSSSPRSCSC